MSPTCRFPLSARGSSRGGFTLVELLVVIGIIAILAGVALGPITNGIKIAKQNTGMQNSRSIALLCFQYSVDNDGTYPPGETGAQATSESIAIQLLAGKYVSDPTIFYNGGAGKTKYASATGAANGFADFAATNISWDFTAVTGAAAGETGVTSNASDLVPMVFCTGSNGLAYTPGYALTLNGNMPYSTDGIAVTFKSNSAQFMKGVLSGAASTVPNFISPAYSDATVYQQIKP